LWYNTAKFPNTATSPEKKESKVYAISIKIKRIIGNAKGQ